MKDLIVYYLPSDYIESVSVFPDAGNEFDEEVINHTETIKYSLEGFYKSFNDGLISDGGYIIISHMHHASFGKHNPNFMEDYEKIVKQDQNA